MDEQTSVNDWWEPCRQRELAALMARTTAILTDLDRDIESAETARELKRLRAEREYVRARPDWMPSRGKARLPSLRKIAGYWAAAGLRADGDISVPSCFGCGWVPPYSETDSVSVRWRKASRYLDRAHLVDRAEGGLDQVQNLIPLCWTWCHRIMPPYGTGQGGDALRWVLDGCPASVPAER